MTEQTESFVHLLSNRQHITTQYNRTMQCVTALIVLNVVTCIALQGTAQRHGQTDYPRHPPLTFPRRFRRQDRGSVSVDARREERPNGQNGQRVRVDADYNIWKSPNGGTRVDAIAYHERNWGSMPGPRCDTGGMIKFTAPIPG